MAFDQNLQSKNATSPITAMTADPYDIQDALIAFEDRLWSAVETIVGSRTLKIGVVAVSASLVHRQREIFASFLSGANHSKPQANGSEKTGRQSLSDDIACTADRLIRQLRQELRVL